MILDDVQAVHSLTHAAAPGSAATGLGLFRYNGRSLRSLGLFILRP